MLNFDMVGRVRDNTVVVVGTGTSSAWPGPARAAPRSTRGTPRGPSSSSRARTASSASDQASYYAADIPVLHFFSGAHDDYHRPTDDFDKINLDGAVAIADLSVRLVACDVARAAGPRLQEDRGRGSARRRLPRLARHRPRLRRQRRRA